MKLSAAVELVEVKIWSKFGRLPLKWPRMIAIVTGA